MAQPEFTSFRTSVRDVFPRNASTWNRLFEGSEEALSKREVFGTTFPDDLKWSVWFQVLNNSGSDVDRGRVLGIEDGWIIDTSEESFIWDAEPTFICITPDEAKHWNKLAILHDPIENGEVGYAFVGGTTIARLFFNNPSENLWHGYADVDNGQSRLRTHPSGSWQILWHEPVAGTTPTEVWAFVRHVGIHQRELFGTADVNIAPSGSGGVTVSTPFTAVSETLTGHYSHFTNGGQINSGQEVLIKWFFEHRHWVIMDTDCP